MCIRDRDKTLMPPEEAKEENDESENSDEDSAENNLSLIHI